MTRSVVFRRFIFIASGIALCLVFASIWWSVLRQKGDLTCKRCNVILIDIQALRADGLPCYGYLRNTAPNICSFADNNIRFTNAYSQASWTLPSLMSLFSSQYPFQHKVQTPDVDVLSPDVITLPMALKKAGYKTVYIGPLNRPHIPLDKGIARGFDEIHKYDTIEDLVLAIDKISSSDKPVFIYFLTYDLIDDLWYDVGHPPVSFIFDRVDTPLRNINYFDTNMRQAMLEHLQEYHSSRPGLEVAFQKLTQTTPFATIQTLYDSLPEEDRQLISYLKVYNQIDPTNPNHMRYVRNFYDDRLYRLDQQMAEVFKKLRDPAVSQNSVVLLLSDHGNEFGDHGIVGHGNNLYASTTHTPLLMSIPNAEPQIRDELIQSIDIFSTILGLLNIRQPKSAQGLNLGPLIMKQPNALSNTYLYGQLEPGPPVISSVRNAQWSLYSVKSETGERFELYSLSTDPKELHNVYDAHPDIARILQKAFSAIR